MSMDMSTSFVIPDPIAVQLNKLPRVKDHTISVKYQVDGSEMLDQNISIKEGESINIPIKPLDGYKLQNVEVDSVHKGRISNIPLKGLAKDCDIRIHLKLKTYKILIDSGYGGTVDPAGVLLLNHGSSIELKIKQDKNYETSEIYLDDEAQDLKKPLILENITKEHRVVVRFKPKTNEFAFKIIIKNPGGKVSPFGVVKINEKCKQLFNVMPDPGKEIESVKLGTVDIPFKNKSFTIDKPTKGGEIKIKFKNC